MDTKTKQNTRGNPNKIDVQLTTEIDKSNPNHIDHGGDRRSNKKVLYLPHDSAASNFFKGKQAGVNESVKKNEFEKATNGSTALRTSAAAQPADQLLVESGRQTAWLHLKVSCRHQCSRQGRWKS